MDENFLNQIPRFTWSDFKNHFEKAEPFEAITPMKTALVRVKSYEPLLGLAVHAGHRVREELLSKMCIDEEERQYEEDFGVDQFVSEFPMQMIALDSRYEYDLNRKRENCVYLKPFESWGKRIWVTPPSRDELAECHTKYDEFHELLSFFVETVIQEHGRALIFDLHSYNPDRSQLGERKDTLPHFNLALTEEDAIQYEPCLTHVRQTLEGCSFATSPVKYAQNDVFIKDGAIALSLEANHRSAWVLPIELKKTYLEEKGGPVDPAWAKTIAGFFGKLGRETLELFQKK